MYCRGSRQCARKKVNLICPKNCQRFKIVKESNKISKFLYTINNGCKGIFIISRFLQEVDSIIELYRLYLLPIFAHPQVQAWI